MSTFVFFEEKRWVFHIAFPSFSSLAFRSKISEELVEELIYAKQLAGEDLWRRPWDPRDPRGHEDLVSP